MRVVKGAQVFGLCRVGEADLAGLDAQVGLSQAASLDEDVDFARLLVALADRRDAQRVRTSCRVGGLEQRVLPLGQNAINNHGGGLVG